MTLIGIHDLSVATAHFVLELDDLAERAGVDPAKYRRGLGQDTMSFPAPDEDIVTMGVAAAQPILDAHGTDGIRTLFFATESGIDQSKSAGVYAHRLLGLDPSVRTVELKQACYGATAAIQAAVGIVARNPGERVLIIASDIARYRLDSPGEPTQGAAAVAMLIGADPGILAIEPVSGVHTADVDDFWRPNDSTTAVVDGALSMSAYLDAVVGCWDDFRSRGGGPFEDIAHIVYHQPFTKMARKGHTRLAEHVGVEVDPAVVDTSSLYNRQLGNSYTASLYASLAALLDHTDGLAGERVGLFSYGSGLVSEFFTGVVQPGYESRRRREQALAAIEQRERIDVDRYRELHSASSASDQDSSTPRVTTGPVRFSGVTGRARRYEETAQA